MGLKALLRDLKASGVRRYVNDKGRVEVEFWGADDGATLTEGEPLEGEALHAAAKAPVYRDPIRAALDDSSFPPIADEADPDTETQN